MLRPKTAVMRKNVLRKTVVHENIYTTVQGDKRSIIGKKKMRAGTFEGYGAPTTQETTTIADVSGAQLVDQSATSVSFMVKSTSGGVGRQSQSKSPL